MYLGALEDTVVFSGKWLLKQFLSSLKLKILLKNQTHIYEIKRQNATFKNQNIDKLTHIFLAYCQNIE